MSAAVHLQVVLATCYAGLLLAVAGALEWLARHTAARSDRYRTAGFTYHPDHDFWLCPRNEPLWPHEVDPVRRLVRYRARPAVCNACPAKAGCTGSRSGREIVRPVDPWPHSEAGRFHRGVSVTLTAAAGAFVVAAAIGYHRPGDLALEAASAALVGVLMWRWLHDFLRTPSGFPEVATLARPGNGAGARPGSAAGARPDRYRSARTEPPLREEDRP